MLVADRYDEYIDRPSYSRSRSSRFSRYDEEYDDRYEAERRDTTDAERKRLMNSLKKSGNRDRVVRRDESRYTCSTSDSIPMENNYDRYLDRRAQLGTRKEEKKVFNKKKTPFVVAYCIVAFVAVIAITLSLVGVKKTETAIDMSTETLISANAEGNTIPGEDVLAAEEDAPVAVQGGEMYVLMKSGELVVVEIPAITEVAEEKETGFDKFCSWLNGIFGGKD